jgi:pre-mRNA-processing factor 39
MNASYAQLEAAVLADPLDFQSWLVLLAFVEQHATALTTVTRAFDWFLNDHFPLCFGYWCKYTDIYERLAGPLTQAVHTAVIGIFERSVAPTSARHCIEMWMHYCRYLMRSPWASTDDTHAVFEAAVAAVGPHPGSWPLWSLYATFEQQQPDSSWETVSSVYIRALSEYLKDLPQVVAELQAYLSTAAPDADAAAARLAAATAACAASTKAVARRAPIESQIVRPFFHVKPIDAVQLAAWRALLDLEESLGASNTERTVMTYERCLVACANYSEFWMRYALWCQTAVSGAAALAVAVRACRQLQLRPDVHLFRADILESLGDTAAARNCYKHVLAVLSPGLLEAAVRLASFERRQGSIAAALSAYRQALSPAQQQQQQQQQQQPSEATRAHIYMQMAQCVWRSSSDAAAARAVYAEATAAAPGSCALWLAYLEFEASHAQAASLQQRVTTVQAVFEAAQSVRVTASGTAAAAANGHQRSAAASLEEGEVHKTGSSSGSSSSAVAAEPLALTVAARADLWDWYEEFLEDCSSDVRRLLVVRAARRWLAAATAAGEGNSVEAALAAAVAAAGAPLGAVAQAAAVAGSTDSSTAAAVRAAADGTIADSAVQHQAGVKRDAAAALDADGSERASKAAKHADAAAARSASSAAGSTTAVTAMQQQADHSDDAAMTDDSKLTSLLMGQYSSDSGAEAAAADDDDSDLDNTGSTADSRLEIGTEAVAAASALHTQQQQQQRQQQNKQSTAAHSSSPTTATDSLSAEERDVAELSAFAATLSGTSAAANERKHTTSSSTTAEGS